MRFVSAAFLLLCLALLPSLQAAPAPSDANADIPTAPAAPDTASNSVEVPEAAIAENSIPAPPRSERPSFLCLPNGWGNTPAAARHDLDRVLALYAYHPGYRRFAFVKIVQVARNSYEADGMCTWDAPDAYRAADPHKNRQ